MSEVRIGTSGWTDKTLLRSGWYPDEAVNDAKKRLVYYATQFPLVEVDSTYYFPPAESNSRIWAERTPDDFVFDIKAYSLLTKHPTKPDSLYKDLRRETDKRNVYADDLDAKVIDQVWERFLSALDPLAEAGKMGAILFQFPPWFFISRANKDYILECAKRAAPYTISVELRNETWMNEGNERETLDFLEGHGLPLVCVDAPQGFKSSMPPIAAATADLSLVRFHGRNAKDWESGSVQKRFAYDYRTEELAEWVGKIEQLSESSESTHVLMNNCYQDYAQRNGRELEGLLSRANIPHPAS
jgi:uncharacterized protein YecE (DUF72 family)